MIISKRLSCRLAVLLFVLLACNFPTSLSAIVGTYVGYAEVSGFVSSITTNSITNVLPGTLTVVTLWACVQGGTSSSTMLTCTDSNPGSYTMLYDASTGGLDSTTNCRITMWTKMQSNVAGNGWTVTVTFSPSQNAGILTVDSFSGVPSSITLDHYDFHYFFQTDSLTYSDFATNGRTPVLTLGLVGVKPTSSLNTANWSPWPVLNTTVGGDASVLTRAYTLSSLAAQSFSIGTCDTSGDGCYGLMIFYYDSAPAGPTTAAATTQPAPTTTAPIPTTTTTSPPTSSAAQTQTATPTPSVTLSSTPAQSSSQPATTTPAPPPVTTQPPPPPPPISPPPPVATTPSPTTPRPTPSNCLNTPAPAPTFVCVGNHWENIGNVTITGPHLNLSLPVFVNGSLTVSPNTSVSLVFSGQPLINVSGSAAFGGSSLNITVKNGTAPGRLIIGYAANVTSTFQTVQISNPSTASHVCSSANSDYQSSDKSIGVLLADCSSKRSSIWIIAIVIGALLVVLVVVAIVVGLYLLKRGKLRWMWREDAEAYSRM